MERLLAASQERNCPVFAAMRHTDVQAEFAPETRQAMQSFIELVERHRDRVAARARPFRLPVWAQAFLEEIGYEADLRRGGEESRSGGQPHWTISAN